MNNCNVKKVNAEGKIVKTSFYVCCDPLSIIVLPQFVGKKPLEFNIQISHVNCDDAAQRHYITLTMQNLRLTQDEGKCWGETDMRTDYWLIININQMTNLLDFHWI